MNAYELIGVDRNADLEQIKQAYRSLAKELHPDVNAGDEAAAERFKEITAAYNLLADRHRRAAYDRFTEAQAQPDGAKPWERGGAWFDFEIDEATGERMIDLFGDIAGTRLGRVKGAAATSLWMRGQDIAERLAITETESREGACRLVATMTGLTVAVDIPPGTAKGDVVTVPGFGIEGYGGGPPGDLNVLIDVVADPALASREPGED